MAEQQLPDILEQIHKLPFDESKRERLFNAFYDDNPKAALEAIQDVPKEIRQSLLTIRGKVYKGEQYDLNDIVNSAKATKTPAVESVKGLGERELKPEELSKEAAQLRKEATQRRVMEEIATVPKPGESKKKSATPFEKKKEEELDFFGRPKEKPGLKLVPSIPRFEPTEEKKTAPPPTVKPVVEKKESTAPVPELTGVPSVATVKPPVEEVYAPSLAKDLFNATVRGIVPGFFNIPRILSRVPGGFREDIEALRTVPSDIQRNEGFIGQEARAKEDALNRKKTAQLIARAEEKVLPEAPVSGVAKFTESTASTAPYIVAGAVGGPYATRAMGAAAGAEEALTRADISGKPLTEGQRAAIGTAGAGIGLTEAIPIDRVIGRLIGAGVANKALTDADIVKLLFPKLGDRLKSAGVQFGAEALQEGFSGLAQNALESMYGGRPVEEIWTDVGNQFAMGGGAGLVIDILSQLAGTRIGRNRLKRMGIDPQAYKEWVESGEADKAKAEAEEIARKAIAPEEAPSAQPEPPPVVDTPAPAAPTAPPATAEQPAPVTTETEIEPVEAPPVIAEPPVTATAIPPVVTATAEPPVVEAKPIEGVTTAEVKDLSLVNPFTGIESTIQIPSPIAAKYETLTGPQKEAAAGNILSFTSTSPESIENEIQSIKTDLEEVEKNPEAITGLDPYFTSVEDFKSFTNEIVIPYLEYLKASSPSPEPATAGPVSATPPPPGLVQQPAPSGETSPAATSVGTKEISVTKTDGTTEKVEIPSALAQKYESLDDNAKGYASETILEAKGLSSSEINQLIRQITVSVEELEANPDPNIFGGDIGQLKSFVNGLIIPFLQYEKTLKTSQEQPLTTAPPPVATPTTPEPPTAPVLAAQPAPTTQAAQVAHPKLNDQGQPVIINSPSAPTPDTTWTDPATTAVFVPEGSAPIKIGDTELKPWTPPQDGWSNISGVNEKLDNRKPFTPTPGKQTASGVIIVEDDGRVWLISPTNQFGGYDNTLPKGKLDPSLSMQENAIKEAWEETGLKVDIIGIVGDYENSTSKVRYYLAKRVGGTPKNMGWEAQAVKLATLDDAKNLLNQQVDKDIISDLEKMVSSGKLAEIKDGIPRKLSTYGQEVSAKIGGSNPGGWYQDGGTKWLVKGNKQKVIGSVTPEQSDARAANEVLASKLLRAVMKIAAPEMKLVDLEGKYGGGLGVASKKVPSFESFNPDNPDHVNAAIKNFATNAWLANYDVLGMGYDNIVITPSGNAMNIDPGGALLFRAQGLPKGASHGVVNGLLDPSAPEFESMQKTTPEQKAVFGKMTPEQLKESAEQLAKITDEKIVKLVNTYGWGSDADKAALADNLIQRKNAILQKAGVTTTSSVAPVAQLSPQVTPQPPSQAVPIQTAPLPVQAAKLQLTGPGFTAEIDAPPQLVADYEFLSEAGKQNAAAGIKYEIEYIKNTPSSYFGPSYKPENSVTNLAGSYYSSSGSDKLVGDYLIHIASELSGKSIPEQIAIIKDIADKFSSTAAQPPQAVAPTTPYSPPSWSTPSLPSSAAPAGAYQPWKDDAPQDVLDKWNSATPDQQAEASIGIHNIVKPVAEIITSGGSPEEVLQFTIDSYENDPWSQQGVKDIIVPYLKHLKSEVVGKSSNEALDYINKVGEDWGLANNWIESVPGYQSYVASQSGQTAPPPSPAVSTQAPPSLTQQAAPAAVQPPQLAAAQPAQQVPQVKIKYKGGSIDAPQNVAAKFSTLNSYWKKKVAQYVSDAATALGGFASQNSSPTEVINYLDNMISIFQSAASSPTSVVAQTANSSVLVPLFEDIKSKFSATTSLITPGSPAAADVSLIYLPFKGLLDNFATPAVTPQQSSQPNTVVSQTAQAPPAGTDQVSTSYGDFVIPSNFVTIFNSMTPGNKESFGKHILEPLFSSITSGASASDIHAKVQSKLTEAQGKLSGYQQKIANGTAVQTDKDRADYYQLVISYLNFVSNTGQVPSQPPPTYISPSGAALSLTPGTLPPKPTWATQLFAQSILSQSPNIINNLASQLSYYGFVNAIKGEANSETQAELNKAQSLVSQSSVDASLIEKAKADGLAKYATIALSYKDVPAKWTRRLFEYIDKPDKFKFAFNPSSSGMTSAQASKSDNQLKNSFDVYQKNEMQSKLTQTQLQHLKDYAGSGYTGLNGSVATAYKSGTPLPNDIAKMVNGDAGSPGLDDAMEKITLGHDMILKRAVSSVNFWSQFGFTSSNQPLDPATMKAMVGQTYTEISYAGTSTDPSWERTIASSPKGKVIFTISANKDVHGIKIYGSPIYGSEGPGAENEVLLHRGTTYIIKSFKFRGYEGGKPIWEAEMMVVDQSPKPLP